MARQNTTRTRGQRGDDQGGAKYRCRWCPQETTHGQAIMSHINGTERKGPNKAAVEAWLKQFPDTKAGRDLRMSQLKIATAAAAPQQRQTSAPRSKKQRPTASETTSTSEIQGFSGAVSQGSGTLNYLDMYRSQLSEEITKLEAGIQEAESYLHTARPTIEEKRRKLQVSEQLVGQSIQNRASVAVGSTQASPATQNVLTHA